MDLIQRAIEVTVTSYCYDPIDQSTILYNVEVRNRAGKSWLLIKRYSQFDDLHKQLKEYFDCIPSLPKKSYLTFFMGKSDSEIDERRRGLDNFLKDIIKRTEIYNSTIFSEFLELNKHTSQTISETPKLVCQFNGFEHGVRDFALDLVNGLLFTLHSDMNVLTRVDAYMTNMKMPWESEGGEPALVTVGNLECWVRDDEGRYLKQWMKGYNAQAITLCWEANSHTILVGLDSGSINLLTLDQKSGFKKYSEVNQNIFTPQQQSIEVEQHNDRVMGVYYDYKRSLIHSVSKDHKYRVLNLEKQVLIAEYEPSDYELTYLLVDQDRQKSFVGDRCGSIFIFDVTGIKPTAVVHLQTTLKFIRGLCVDSTKNFLFAIGLEEGEMIVFDINKSGREEETKEVARLKNRPQSREICWSGSRGEIYAGNQDGTVTIWDAKKTAPIYILKAHEDDITKLVWLEKEHTLLTGSKDKSIKAWKFPSSWQDIKQVQKEELEAEKVLRQEQVQELKKQIDSDEDEDLGSWHK